MNFILLTGGLVLGWSLGANNTADIFGTAVGSKMVKLKTALTIASIFVILGAVLQGTNTTKSIGELGKINAIGGAFTVCLATGLTVIWMTKAGFLVSITQALVGGIVGWSLFAGELVNINSLTQIIKAWIISPLIAFLFAFLLYKYLHRVQSKAKINLFTIDYLLRLAFILLGAFGAFSFGANNIANIVGAYIFSNPFKNIYIGNFEITALQILLFVGALSIAIGILTGSKRVMKTVGEKILKLSPLAGIVVVFTQAIVLLLFSSDILRKILMLLHLPTLPLVPISSSQVVIGAMIGIGLARGAGRLINFKVLKDIALAWIITPISAGILSFVMLFFTQNVFQLTVRHPIRYTLSKAAIQEIEKLGIETTPLKALEGEIFENTINARSTLLRLGKYNKEQIYTILDYMRIDSIVVDTTRLREINLKWFTPEEINEIKKLHGKVYIHSWEFKNELLKTPVFSKKILDPGSKKEFKKEFELLVFLFRKPYK
ncbi:MAG: inorganic phosphate transporter [bacterium]|nr:inorganic phosphate transporter [bacterium]